MNPITFTPIGTIHSPFTDLEGMPLQPAGTREALGSNRCFLATKHRRCYLNRRRQDHRTDATVVPTAR